MRTLKRLRLQPDEGFTLIELLMFILLFGMISAVVTMVSTSGLHHQRELQDRSDAIAQARTAIQRIDRDIRSTDRVLKMTATTLLMQENSYTGSTATGKRWVCYYENASNQLVAVSETTPTDCSVTVTGTSTVLVSNLTNDASSPASSLFTALSTYAYVAPLNSGINSTSCSVGGTPTAYAPSCIGTITVLVLTKPSSINKAVSVSDGGTELRNIS